MAGSEMRGTDAGRAVEADIERYKDQASVELSAAQAREGTEQPGSRRLAGYRSSQADRTRMIKDARETEFPVALRGYDRAAVDRYVTEVTRLIAELELTASPESAVRRALEEVSEETRGLLERAHQTAEEITARSRIKADDRVKQAEEEARALRQAAQQDADEIREAAQRDADATREAARREAHELRTSAQREAASSREMAAGEINAIRDTAMREAQHLRAAAQQEADRLLGEARREAEELLDAAEIRARELAQNAETIWRDRRRLVDDIRAIGEQLTSIGDTEAKRFPRLSEAVPSATVASRATKASLAANGGAGPERENGGSEPRGQGSEAEFAAAKQVEKTRG
jgi:DivIVA domain-containing protein